MLDVIMTFSIAVGFVLLFLITNFVEKQVCKK